MKAIEHFIQSILIPSDCASEKVIQFFQREFLPMSLKKGDFLTKSGDTNYKLYFVHSGLIRVFSDTPSGDQFTQTFIREGQIGGEMNSYWQKSASPFSAQALEESEVLYCDYKKYDDLSLIDLEFAKLLLAEVKQYKIRHETRELLLQSLSVEEYYRRIQQEYPDLDNRIAQTHIASYMGVSEVTLSRIKKKLKSEQDT